MGALATPLMALDAIILDTETTALDARTARVLEIAAVRLVRGRLDLSQPFHRLVQPGEPIPAAASKIHGISDSTLAGAPRFGEVWQDLSSYLAKHVLVGHSVGYDLAILKRECE